MFDDVLRDMSWHCDKFLRPGKAISSEIETLIELLNTEYQSELSCTLMRMCGLPSSWITQFADHSTAAVVLEELSKAIRIEATLPWRLYGDDIAKRQWPHLMGELQLGVVNAALSHVPRLPAALRHPFHNGCNQLVEVRNLQAAWLDQFPEATRPRAAAWLALNCIRLNSPLLQFAKPYLWERIKAMDHTSATEISDFIDAASRMAISATSEADECTFVTTSMLPGFTHKLHARDGILPSEDTYQNVSLCRYGDEIGLAPVINCLISYLL